jgi:hypothetical protein
MGIRPRSLQKGFHFGCVDASAFQQSSGLQKRKQSLIFDYIMPGSNGRQHCGGIPVVDHFPTFL